MEAKTLVLDASYQAIGMIKWQTAMKLWCQDKIEIIEEYADLWIHSATQAFKVPSVIRFLKKVLRRTRKIKYSRENIYLRDKGLCQYCNIPVTREEFTIDHIIPKSQGGKTSWENAVICCVDCNRYKANKTPAQAGMKLKSDPVRPKSLYSSFGWMKNMPSSWKDFLISANYWNGELENDI